MSTTLSYGFKLPQDGDTGANDFWDDLESDITQLNNHTHNGSDSAKLTSTSITSVSHAVDNTVTALLTTGWVLQTDGGYKRTINIASFFSTIKFDEVSISWRVFTSVFSGENGYDIFFPTIEKIGVSTYNVTLNIDVTTLSSPYFLVVYSS